jgi:hypothetical protein
MASKSSFSDEVINVDLSELDKVDNEMIFLKYIQSVIPEWIESVAESYSDDYNFMQQNWQDMCKSILKCKPRIILLVKYIETDSSTTTHKFVY